MKFNQIICILEKLCFLLFDDRGLCNLDSFKVKWKGETKRIHIRKISNSGFLVNYGHWLKSEIRGPCYKTIWREIYRGYDIGFIIVFSNLHTNSNFTFTWDLYNILSYLIKNNEEGGGGYIIITLWYRMSQICTAILLFLEVDKIVREDLVHVLFIPV